jgi:hypothetical protein
MTLESKSRAKEPPVGGFGKKERQNKRVTPNRLPEFSWDGGEFAESIWATVLGSSYRDRRERTCGGAPDTSKPVTLGEPDDSAWVDDAARNSTLHDDVTGEGRTEPRIGLGHVSTFPFCSFLRLVQIDTSRQVVRASAFGVRPHDTRRTRA